MIINTKIKLSISAIFIVSMVILCKHLTVIFNIPIPFNIIDTQGNVSDSIFSTIVNVLLLTIVFLKVTLVAHKNLNRISNVFLGAFILLFILMFLQSLQTESWFLLFAAIINIVCLIILILYNQAYQEKAHSS